MTVVSVLVTSYHEPDTLPRALEALLPQLPADSEVLVICPDDETAQAAARDEWV